MILFFEVILAASSVELELEAMTKYFWDKVESEDELVDVMEVSSRSVDANGVFLVKSPAMMASNSVVFDEVAILKCDLSVRWKNLQSNEIFEKLDTSQLWPPPISSLLSFAQCSRVIVKVVKNKSKSVYTIIRVEIAEIHFFRKNYVKSTPPLLNCIRRCFREISKNFVASFLHAPKIQTAQNDIFQTIFPKHVDCASRAFWTYHDKRRCNASIQKRNPQIIWYF